MPQVQTDVAWQAGGQGTWRVSCNARQAWLCACLPLPDSKSGFVFLGLVPHL